MYILENRKQKTNSNDKLMTMIELRSRPSFSRVMRVSLKQINSFGTFN